MMPCALVAVQGLVDGWRARKEWVCEDGGIDTHALQALAGGGASRVWVTDTAR